MAQNSETSSDLDVHWSDAAFAIWSGLNLVRSSPRSNLRYVIQSSVVNEVTKVVLGRIIDILQPRYPLQKTISPSKESEWFFALLGTPNGAGVGYLLLDHKGVLGFKTVTSITIFGKNPDALLDVLFQIQDMPPKANKPPCGPLLANSTAADFLHQDNLTTNTSQLTRLEATDLSLQSSR